MWRTLQRVAVVVVVGAVLGVVANGVSPRKIALFPAPAPVAPVSDFLPLEEVKQLWLSGAAVFLDARAPADYATGHIAGAYNVPAEQFAKYFSQVAPQLTPETALLAYCDGMECDLSHDLAAHLRQLGFKKVHILRNGWTVWRSAGLSTSKGDQP